MPRRPLDPKTQALKLLSRREHSARELTRKLTARGITPEDASAAVAHAASEDWQSDARYAGMLVRSRVAQGYGPMRIQSDLQQAGVPRDDIRAALDEAGVDWREHAIAAHQKKFGALPNTSAERAKHYRYLQGRGFDGGQIAAALKGEVED
ncbi:MAG TPA: regulatory protein RecX [Verrucomicrobiae bacterium]|nr:regulatory protein RecX [Verrucomicrobiae bacterium]